MTAQTAIQTMVFVANKALHVTIKSDHDVIERGQKITVDDLVWEIVAYDPETRRMRLERACQMTRVEIISRRFEAMRMRWPERAMMLFQREALILCAPYLLHKL